MAMQVKPLLIGVDVSEAELVICREGETLEVVANEPAAIGQWLKTLPALGAIALEATNTYHLELAEQAYRRGHAVYVIDGLRLERYRQCIGVRAKTDRHDAQLLRRYLEKEQADLRRWTPPPAAYLKIQRLLRRRATLVKATVALRQSFAECPELKHAATALLRQLARIDTLLTRHLCDALVAHGWDQEAARCRDIEGVGPVTSAALTMAYHRGHFRHSDAFIAFIGFDVRVRDSGKHRGQRKLTKQGDPELRRLLYLAAMRACRTATWQAFYQRYLARGLSKTQALVILARKLARIAFALLRHHSVYQPRVPQTEACSAT